AFVWVPVTALVASRFPQKRVMALGIATTGITIGQMTVPPLMAYYISSEGWRYSYVVLAIIIIITTIPAVLVLGSHSKQQAVVQNGGKETNRAPGGKEETPVQQHQWSAREAVRTVPFWMLLLNGFVIASGFYFVSTHIVAYATDIIPGTTSAPLILTFMGAASVCGKLTVSSIATKIGSRSTLFIILSLQALALFSFMQANSLWVLFVGGAIFGLGFGAASPVRMALVPELFGLRSVATIIGLVNVAWSVGGTVGPVLAGYAFDISQSYELAFLAGGLLMMSGLVATYFLRPIPVSAIRLPVNEE
ncbi:MAG: MFS transporter, partial [Chloroflexi bacterium]|nr:MFS transporter [Chloroflexota bacterium]